MKFFIINSFRMIVYIAYFAIIVIQTIQKNPSAPLMSPPRPT